jgi:hypothetical protein
VIIITIALLLGQEIYRFSAYQQLYLLLQVVFSRKQIQDGAYDAGGSLGMGCAMGFTPGKGKRERSR